jgi:uracil-DNA glycosylase family 4
VETISLFPPDARQVIETVSGREVSNTCQLCKLCNTKGLRTVGIPADGEAGGLLVVLDKATKHDDALGRVASGPAGAYLRRQIGNHWAGPVVYDLAIRCAPGEAEVSATEIRKCRPYLAQTIAEAHPSRILALGNAAFQAITGRSFAAASMRRGYTWVGGIPVFFNVTAASVLPNRFQQAAFEEDIRWALTCDPFKEIPPPPRVVPARVVVSPQEARDAAYELRKAPWFAYDVETAGRHYEPGFEVLSLAACATGSSAPFVWSPEAIADPQARKPLADLLEDRKVGKVGQNEKYDALSIRAAWGVTVRGLYGDTMLWRALLDHEAERNLAILGELVGFGGHKEEAHDALAAAKDGLKRAMKQEKTDVRTGQVGLFYNDEKDPPFYGLNADLSKLVRAGVKLDAVAYKLLPREILLRYNALDALVTARLAERLEVDIKREPSLHRTWTRVLRGAAEAVVHVEAWGAGVDRGGIGNLDQYLAAKIKMIEARLSQYDANFNPDSTPQVAKLLYDTLKIKAGKLTATGLACTDSEALEAIRDKHPIVGDILEHRRLAKLHGTYVVGLAKHIRSDGRIHPSFRLDGTRTGRWSCEAPNLQNVVRVEEGDENADANMIKGCFRAPPGHLLLQCDYKQVEYRVAGMVSGDPVLIELFRQGHDMHLGTAKIVAPLLGVDPELVDKKHWLRQFCKCFHPDTEVLTRKGWKKILSLSPGEEVLQAIPSDGVEVQLQWVVPLEVFSAKHPSEKLVHLKNEGMDLRVTPDHRMLIFGGKKGVPKVVRPAEMAPQGFQWANAGVLESGSRTEDERLLRLAVAVQADGSYGKSGSIAFGFKKKRKIERLRELLRGEEYSEYPEKNGVTRFYLPRKVADPIKRLLDDKKLPWWWLNLTLELRKAVLEEAQFWDSHKAANWRHYNYSTTLEQNADVLQAIAATTARKTRKVRRGDQWAVSVKERRSSLSGHLAIKTSKYTAEVACISVPSSFVLVRDGGIPVICGQTINFLLLFGGGDSAAAKKLGCKVAQAAQVRAAIMGSFKGLAKWLKDRVTEAKAKGCVWTFIDGEPARRSNLWKIAETGDSERNRLGRSNAEHAATNHPIQGSAADFTSRSLAEMVSLILDDGLPAKLILTVHDSLLFEVKEEDLHEVAHVANTVMCGWPTPHNVPLEVDLEAGKTWSSLERYTG